MTRTALTVTQYGSDDAGVSISWQNVDRVNQNSIADPRNCMIVARNTLSSTRAMTLTATKKGVTITKTFTIPVVASFGQYILADIDMKFWGDHGGTDPGYLYLDWGDSSANTDVAVGVIRRAV